MHFKIKILTVEQIEYAEPQLRQTIDLICESLEDAEEGAIMHLEMLAKHHNGNLWNDDRIILSITQTIQE
ncbi:MAG: hypothetical protein U1D69_01665 [Polynucleobacter sp.]|nr:hypothetical protein [Polynucleobacter sp.]